MIHLYVGSGKGKTTAAVGLSIRMLGYGHGVLFCRFLKGESGEINPLRRLGSHVINAPHTGKFTFQMSPEELKRAGAANARFLGDLREIICNGGFALIVLDEIIDAVNTCILNIDEVIAFIKNIPQETEIVLTGRDPDVKIVALADYHTEFVSHRHPYEKGVQARRGIEY